MDQDQYSSQKITKRFTRKTRQLGQGMVEYIIIVAVVALGSIAVYAAFGDVLRGQVGNATDVLGGSSKSHASDISAAKTKATNNAKKDMSNY